MGSKNETTSRADPLAFLAGSGEMGERIRTFDWSQTPIGPVDRWPQSLKTAAGILLNARCPMFIWWGHERITLYNDASIPVLGARHPQALGQPARHLLADLWPGIEPQSQLVLNGGRATEDAPALLMMERYGYTEETYFTCSYSPVLDNDGGVGGVFCTCIEDTQRVIGERQVALLRDVAARTATARTWQEASVGSVEALRTNPRDLPFALIYTADPGGSRLSLAGAGGIERGHPAAPEAVRLTEQTSWPFEAVLSTREVVVLDLQTVVDAPLPTGAWKEPPTQAALVPIAAPGQTGTGGVLVVGLNPFRSFDDGYRHFLTLVGNQIAASMARAQTYEDELVWARSESPPGKTRQVQPELQRARIVWADDDADVRTRISRILGERFEVETVADGQAALEAVRANPPDLVLSAVMMPRLDGLGLLRALRADPQLQHIPIILLSTRADQEAHIEGIEAGADDYLMMPFSARELLARVEAHIKLARVRVKMNKALRKSEERVRLASAAARLGTYSRDLRTGEDYWSPEFLAIYGIPSSTSLPLRDGIPAAVHPDDRERVLAEARARLAGIAEPEFSSEHRIILPDGAIRWVMVRGRVDFDAQGQPLATHGIAMDITDLKQAEQALRKSEERYRAIVESQMEMVCRFRPDGTILFVNGAYARARGTTPEALTRANFWNFIEEEDRPGVRAMLDRLRPEAPEVRIENRFETTEGVRWTLWANRGLVFDADGQATEVQSSGIDITDRKRAEQALRESEAKLQRIVNNAPVAIAVVQGNNLEYVSVNPAYQAILPNVQFIGRTHRDVFPEAADRGTEARLREVMRTGRPWKMRDFQTEIPGRPSMTWWEGECLPLPNEHGEIDSVLVLTWEITERKVAEEALRRHAEEIQTLLDTLPVGVLFAHDPEGQRITGNRAGYELLRVPMDSNLSKSAPAQEQPTHFRAYRNGVELPADQLPVQRAARGETIHNEEVVHVFEDGTVLNLLISAAPLHDSRGQSRGAVASVLDVTDRTRAEQALRDSETRYRGLSARLKALLEMTSRLIETLETTELLSSLLDLACEIVDADAFGVWRMDSQGNWSMAASSGLSDAFIRESLSSSWNDQIPIEPIVIQPEDLADRSTSLLSHRWARYKAEGIRSLMILPLPIHGTVSGTLVFYRRAPRPFTEVEVESARALANIAAAAITTSELYETLEERVEERTQQVRELARRLTMAEQEERRRISQILHDDLQQLLYGIEMKISMIRQDLQKAGHADLIDDLDGARAWIRRGVATTRQLTVDLSPPILNTEGLADMISWLRTQMRELHGLEVTIKAAHGFYISDGDLRVLLFQIVRELLFNVKKHAGVDQAVVELKEEEGHLVIHVTDEGRGFDVEEVVAREKQAGGFGLYSARERLRLLGGHLEVRSRPGGGTHIAVHAPVRDGEGEG